MMRKKQGFNVNDYTGLFQLIGVVCLLVMLYFLLGTRRNLSETESNLSKIKSILGIVTSRASDAYVVSYSELRASEEWVQGINGMSACDNQAQFKSIKFDLTKWRQYSDNDRPGHKLCYSVDLQELDKIYSLMPYLPKIREDRKNLGVYSVRTEFIKTDGKVLMPSVEIAFSVADRPGLLTVKYDIVKDKFDPCEWASPNMLLPMKDFDAHYTNDALDTDFWGGCLVTKKTNKRFWFGLPGRLFRQPVFALASITL